MFAETPHLILRDLQPTDFAALHNINDDPEVFLMNDFVPSGEVCYVITAGAWCTIQNSAN